MRLVRARWHIHRKRWKRQLFFMLLTFPVPFGICCEIPENASEYRGADASERALPFRSARRFNPFSALTPHHKAEPYDNCPYDQPVKNRCFCLTRLVLKYRVTKFLKVLIVRFIQRSSQVLSEILSHYTISKSNWL